MDAPSPSWSAPIPDGGSEWSEEPRECDAVRPMRISDSPESGDTEVRSDGTVTAPGSEGTGRDIEGEFEAEQSQTIEISDGSSPHSARSVDCLTLDTVSGCADSGVPTEPHYGQRRMTSASEEACLQRTRSGEDSRQAHRHPGLPYRSISLTGHSSSRSSAAPDPGSSYATAIDITSSPPEAGPSGANQRSTRRSSNTPNALPYQTQTFPRYYSNPDNFVAAQSPATHTSSSNTYSMPRMPRRQHSTLLRENTSDNMQAGRPRVQSDAVRSRSLRYSGIEFPPWQPGTMDEENLRRAINVDDEEVEPDLPRWQPDSEVDFCPICGNEFSFWYRKHHCRKCGRVVCASCSPHRITIPRQYIVRPPDSGQSKEASPAPARQVVDLTGDEPVILSPVLNPALGGGEEVRLCNPCVPDPNPNPLSYGPLRSRGHRSTHSLPSIGNLLTRPVDEDPDRDRENRGYSPEFFQYPGAEEQRRQASQSQYYVNPPRQSLPLAHQPRRRTISEEDLCPICGRLFPELSPENPAEAREAHVRDCIENFGASAPRVSGPSTPTSGATTTRRGPAPPPPPPPPAARMVEFTATEKDCIGEDGGVGECTICMEDYEVGESLARLECLCKFHKDCIIGWFKQKMECPVHKYC
ncbi:hypothetical protein N7468_006229 [Penicillium chermesinum]|uniref:RING-type E3 ubiquitin transferase n=1 Tax=Penicillium chermesinum TaxID=63820 RepID=A0A9W9TJM9_9EURO|nr:uncharacterized protein N7468_006229 [Penicillium chermesinum]KAJ5225004.1 hypothetical protein N7468_006229 [Penicillium chermesinum]KAJ6151735.1 hypothetical protein N7470_006863 [Penicillium chermesinum]